MRNDLNNNQQNQNIEPSNSDSDIQSRHPNFNDANRNEAQGVYNASKKGTKARDPKPKTSNNLGDSSS